MAVFTIWENTISGDWQHQITITTNGLKQKVLLNHILLTKEKGRKKGE